MYFLFVFFHSPFSPSDGSASDPINPRRFRVTNYIFTKHLKDWVLRSSPHIPVNCQEERSCYSILLLHVPWPDTRGFDESDILGEHSTAVARLQYLMEKKLLPAYVLPTLANQIRSETIFSNQGQPSCNTSDARDDIGQETSTEMATEQNSDMEEDELYIERNDTNEDLAESIQQYDKSGRTEVNNENPEQQPVLGNITPAKYRFYRDYITTKLKEVMETRSKENQLQSDEDFSLFEVNKFVNVDRYAERQSKNNEQVERFNDGQRIAFEKFKKHVFQEVGCCEPLLMFLTGEGGTGKSEVIRTIMEWSKLHFGKQPGLFGAVVALAPTGSAAFNIGGFTWHSAVGNPAKWDSIIDQKKVNSLTHKWKGVKVLIIDEISMITPEDMYQISDRIKKILIACSDPSDIREREIINKYPFGGLHVILSGDFYQLPPAFGSRKSLVDPNASNPNNAMVKLGRTEIWNKINEFCELLENMRLSAMFNLGPQETEAETYKNRKYRFALFLQNARLGRVTQDDLDLINTRLCLSENDQTLLNAGTKALWMTATNQKVAELNKANFLKLVNNGAFHYRFIAKHCLQGDQLLGVDKVLNESTTEKLFKYQHKDFPPTTVDLAIGSRVRVTENLAIQLGIYNGALGTVVGFRFLKDIPSTEDEMMPKKTTLHKTRHANREIPVVLVQMDNETMYGNLQIDGMDNVFPFTETLSFRTIPKSGNYHRLQIPLELAHATTVHKAQGITAFNGAVADPTPISNIRWKTMGSEYVQYSRATSVDKVWSLSPVMFCHFNDNSPLRTLINNEYSRLRKIFN